VRSETPASSSGYPSWASWLEELYISKHVYRSLEVRSQSGQDWVASWLSYIKEYSCASSKYSPCSNVGLNSPPFARLTLKCHLVISLVLHATVKTKLLAHHAIARLSWHYKILIKDIASPVASKHQLMDTLA
ncbi:Chromosome segregation ATPase, partial [Giardia duodenalis]